MNLTEVIRAVIDRHICTRQSSDDNKRLLTEALVKAIPKREHGKWIHKCIYGDRFCECSVCRSQTYQVSPLYEFCPHCGADMRGEKR